MEKVGSRAPPPRWRLGFVRVAAGCGARPADASRAPSSRSSASAAIGPRSLTIQMSHGAKAPWWCLLPRRRWGVNVEDVVGLRLLGVGAMPLVGSISRVDCEVVNVLDSVEDLVPYLLHIGIEARHRNSTERISEYALMTSG